MLYILNIFGNYQNYMIVALVIAITIEITLI